MKNVLKTGLFYLVVFTMVLGNSMLSIDFSTPSAHAEEVEEVKPEVLASKVVTDPRIAPNVISAELTPSGVLISWDEITGNFEGYLWHYKVVMSQINTTPAYPLGPNDILLEDFVGPSLPTSYLYEEDLNCGEDYYFSVTAKYTLPEEYMPGNAVSINVPCEPVCDSTISGYKYLYDGQETSIGLQGWDISLTEAFGSQNTVTVVTDINGYYEFTDICYQGPSDEYRLYEYLQAGWNAVNPSTGYYMDVFIDAPDTHLSRDFYNEEIDEPTGELRMCKQEDADGDADPTDTDPMVFNWDFIVDGQITYNDADDGIVDGCATIDVPYGTYNVDEIMQSGWSRTGTDGNGIEQPDGSVDVTIGGPATYIVYFLNQQDQEEPEECPEEDNLIINYSFEEPVVTNASLWQKMSSVLGWVIERVSDNSATTLELHKGWSSNEAADGLQYAELDGDHSTRITQDVVTEEGAEYKLFWSFAARHNITAEQNHLSVEVNGSQIGTNGPIVGSAPLTQNDWENSNYVFTADSTNTEITLEDIGPSDTYGTFVDNVRLCKIADPEPDPEPAPWCSALMGAFKAYYDPSSSVHGVYNEVIDVYKGDGLFEVINLSDEGLVKTMYHEANDAVCYEQFEDEEGFNFQCEDEEVGWCGGLKQGIADFYGQTYINDDLHPRYDLNNDDVVNLSDSVLLAQLIGTDNQAECYTYYVPPFLMCENPEPICGNGGEPEVGEQCDDGNLINGDGCSSSCQLENTPPPPCSGCGTTFAIRDLKSDISCSAFDISWRTTKNSDTILDLGTESGVYTENINNDTNTGNHSLSIADLLPNTTYYYKVRAISTSGKEIEVSEKSFTTPPTEQCEEVLGEKIIGDPLICDFLRPSGSVGGDLDIDGVFQYPNGSLLRDACVPTMPVYLIKDQQKWHVPTWQYLHDKHFGERIYNVVTTVLDYYPDWTGEVLGVKDYADGTLLRGNDMKVYILDKGEKQHINTLEKLAKYLGQDIINVSDEVLARY